MNTRRITIHVLRLLSSLWVAFAAMPRCQQSPYEWWNATTKSGERAFAVTQHGDGGGSMTCLAKGFSATDEVLDPVVRTVAHIANIMQDSMMPCQIFAEAFGKKDVRPIQKQVPLNGTTDLSGMAGHQRHLGNDCSTLGAPSTCTYPNAPKQSSWGGVKFKISMVNDNHTTESQSNRNLAYELGNTGVPNEIGYSFTHAPVHGGAEDVCRLEDGNTHLYSSGVVFENMPLPYDMKYKVYAFASEAERQLALADPRNEGLEYARTMKGENGCDVEIIFEFFPRKGGGLWVEISQTMGDMSAPASSPLHRITDSTEAFAVPGENYVVVRVSSSAIRATQYLPHRDGCDDGKTSTIKFSTEFICKATGQRVPIKRMTMSRTHPGGKYEHDLSTDPSNPTTFQVDPANPTDCYRNMDCAGHQHSPDFRLYMDANDAPESCGSFYWDPLLHAVPGDGQSASAIGIAGSADGPFAGHAGLKAASAGVMIGWPRTTFCAVAVFFGYMTMYA